MAARLSGLTDAARTATRAEELAALALRLADEDASGYGAVIGALRLPPQPGAARRGAIDAALVLAAGAPSEIARVAHETALLAAELVSTGNANLRGDAAAGALLAAAAARAAALLVEIDLARSASDERVRESALLADEAEAAARRAASGAAGSRSGPLS